jgi:two-component system, LytTR family, sensor kinase
LRAFIKKMNWFTLPIEKIILKLIIAGILTSFVFAIFQTGFFKIFNLFGGKKLDVFVRILASLVNAMSFIITWTMIYYFFHYYQKTAKEQIQNRRMQRLLSKKESDFEKSTVDVHFIENSLE